MSSKDNKHLNSSNVGVLLFIILLKVLGMLLSFPHIHLLIAPFRHPPPSSWVIQLSVCILWLGQLRGQVNGCFSELWAVQQLEKMTSLCVWEARKRNLTIKFTQTRTHTQALSHSSFPVKLGWWGQPFLVSLTPRWQTHYSRVSGDLGVKVILANSLQSSFPAHHAAWATQTPRSIQITDSSGDNTRYHISEWLKDTWAPSKKLFFCSTTMFLAVRFSTFFKCPHT